MARDEALVFLVVDEWDTTAEDVPPDESAAAAEDSGAVPGRAFGFTAEDIAGMIGVEAGDWDAVEHALTSLLEGEDVEDLTGRMLDRASDAVGWCVLSSHLETE